MSLGTKTLLILLASVLGYALIDLLVQQKFIQPSYGELERAETQRDLERCVEALRRELHHLDQFTQDWSAWDDTLDYVEGRRTKYPDENLDLRTYIKSDINLITLIDRTGHVAWSSCYDLSTKEPVALPELPGDSWPSDHPLLRHVGFDSTITGVFSTTHGPLLLCSRPVVASYKQDHIGGTLIMGRFLNGELISTLRSQTQVDMAIDAIDRIADPAMAAEVKANQAQGRRQWITEEARDLLAYAALPDVFGKPALLLRVRVPRIITEKGARAVLMDSIGGMSGGLVTLLVVVALMRWAVTKPLQQFTARVSEMAGRGELAPVPVPNRNDEIAEMARAFNVLETRVRSTFEERLRAEARIVEMQDSVARSQRLAEIGQMGASVAHEIRNPITGISGAAQVLLHGMAADHPQREILEEILHQCRRVENTVRQLLGYARPLQPHLVLTDLRAVVEGTVDRAVRDQVVPAGVVDIEGPSAVWLKCDPELIMQVVLNLLTNAVQAAGDTPAILLSLGESEKFVVLRVEDEGPGFSDLVAANRFAPFETTKVYGTGLGLNICRRIVEAHGGDIQVSNREPRGACVEIRLPREIGV